MSVMKAFMTKVGNSRVSWLPHIQGQLHFKTFSMCIKRFVITILIINCRRIWSNISEHWQKYQETPSSISSCSHMFSNYVVNLNYAVNLNMLLIYTMLYYLNYVVNINIYLIYFSIHIIVRFWLITKNYCKAKKRAVGCLNASSGWVCSRPKRVKEEEQSLLHIHNQRK
jgi:hypothetical protein